jgi:hypothetical protein
MATHNVDALAIPAQFDRTGKAKTNGQADEIAQMKAMIAQLMTENQKLKAAKARAITMKVSEKGGLSLYGMGRFPVTLYKQQWLKLLDMADAIREFITAHDGELTTKE